MNIAAIVLASAVSAAFAQDPVRVGPEIYKKAFENEQVRVNEVTFKPGDKIGRHSHPDHFVYIIEPGKLRITRADGKTEELDGKPGQVIWMKSEAHSAENIGGTEFKALVVEMKKGKGMMEHKH